MKPKLTKRDQFTLRIPKKINILLTTKADEKGLPKNSYVLRLIEIGLEHEKAS